MSEKETKRGASDYSFAAIIVALVLGYAVERYFDLLEVREEQKGKQTDGD